MKGRITLRIKDDNLACGVHNDQYVNAIAMFIEEVD